MSFSAYRKSKKYDLCVEACVWDLNIKCLNHKGVKVYLILGQCFNLLFPPLSDPLF